MHRAQCATPTNKNIKITPPVSNIKENHRNTIFESTSPPIEIFNTNEIKSPIVSENDKKKVFINYRPRIFYEWKEPSNKNNEKFITGKIGQM